MEMLLYETIIEMFNPLIKKFSTKLSYEEAETDLIIIMIEMLYSMDLNNFDEEKKRCHLT